MLKDALKAYLTPRLGRRGGKFEDESAVKGLKSVAEVDAAAEHAVCWLRAIPLEIEAREVHRPVADLEDFVEGY